MSYKRTFHKSLTLLIPSAVVVCGVFLSQCKPSKEIEGEAESEAHKDSPKPQFEGFNPEDVYYDYSYAGYREGKNIPTDFASYKKVDVTEFGAIANDGKDDTEAFRHALKVKAPSLVIIPEGVFDFSDILEMTQSHQVLSGQGEGKTILKFHKGLEELYPKPVKNGGGKQTSRYSWSGGFIQIKGRVNKLAQTKITSKSSRLSEWLEVEDTKGFAVGDEIVVRQYHQTNNGLLEHLYVGDTDDISKSKPGMQFDFPARIVEISQNKLRLDRGCRTGVNPAWDAEVFKPEYSIAESGLQNFTVKFPEHHYKGHFKEVGFNVLEAGGMAHCWVKNLEIVNCDSGLFVRGTQCTIENVVIRSPGVKADSKGFVGHHGITLSGTNHLLRNFEYKDVFIHDITLGLGASGQVVTDGKAKNLSLDHHKRAPNTNLFTNIDLGKGTRFLASGGGPKIGRNSAAWSTFWNMKSEQAVTIPSNFAPKELIFVGVDAENLDAFLRYKKSLQREPSEIGNLYSYQLAKRLKLNKN